MKYTQETIGGWITYEDHETNLHMSIWTGLFIVWLVVPLLAILCGALLLGLLFLIFL